MSLGCYGINPFKPEALPGHPATALDLPILGAGNAFYSERDCQAVQEGSQQSQDQVATQGWLIHP